MVTFKLCSFKFNFFAFYSAFCCFFSSATFDSIVTSVSRKFLFPIPSKYNAENGKHVLQISVSARGNSVMKSSTFTSVTREHTSESGVYTKQKVLILQAITFWASCCGSNCCDWGGHTVAVLDQTQGRCLTH